MTMTPREAYDHAGCCLLRDVLKKSDVTYCRDQLEQDSSQIGAGNRRLAETFPDMLHTLNHRMQEECLRPHFGNDFFLVRVLLFDKTPEANWPALWHQDLTIHVSTKHELTGFGPWSLKNNHHHVQPPAEILQNMITLRVHLDDAGADTGGLRVIPGSHQHGIIRESEIPTFNPDTHATDCEARVGDVLAMNPLLLHASRRSPDPTHRRVIHMEYATGDLPPPLEWGMDSRYRMG